jgi:nitrile hydratase
VTYTTHADLGGLSGFGAVTFEPEGELFHASWEPRALALTVAMGATGAWNLDMMRSARETLPNYRELSYYEIWLDALQSMLEKRALVTSEEVSAERMLQAASVLPRVLRGADVEAALARGAPTERSPSEPARYAVGQKVRARKLQVNHHTRLPSYVLGKVGVVEQVRGVHVFADTHSQGLGEQPQWLYAVIFNGTELWGETSSTTLKVCIDAFEPYLETP